ncbi:hypothetical protein QBC41DRAFT_315549 [Cercophora samala]|uniref:Secreted protein n=1 Tax=Cercophora samala TaxID=330535 RepID=A0AA39ZJ07_9PEZI|nr:hypothetical protein QBC41DRAFT_315549 [Cercophora samala]
MSRRLLIWLAWWVGLSGSVVPQSMLLSCCVSASEDSNGLVGRATGSPSSTGPKGWNTSDGSIETTVKIGEVMMSICRGDLSSVSSLVAE